MLVIIESFPYKKNLLIYFSLHYPFLYSILFICMDYRKHINIRITQDQFQWLIKTVDEQESNLSELVRKMIDNCEKRKAKKGKNK